MKRTVLFMTIAVLACHKAETPAARGTAAPQTPQRTKAPSPSTSSPATTSSAAEATGAPTNVGDPMPGYQAKLLDGSPYDLASEKGHVILLNVWATWCGPCKYEIPQLQKLHDQYASRGFKVVGVSVDEGDAGEVKKFVTDRKMTYPIAVDPDGKIANLLQTMVLPTSVLLDRNGKIVWRSVGALEPDDTKLSKAIDAAVGGVGVRSSAPGSS